MYQQVSNLSDLIWWITSTIFRFWQWNRYSDFVLLPFVAIDKVSFNYITSMSPILSNSHTESLFNRRLANVQQPANFVAEGSGWLTQSDMELQQSTRRRWASLVKDLIFSSLQWTIGLMLHLHHKYINFSTSVNCRNFVAKQIKR